MSLRHWIRRVEAASKEAVGMDVLIDERDGETFHVPRDVFLKVLDAGVTDEPHPAIAELVSGMEEDPNRLQHLFYSNGDPFWWQPEECIARGDEVVEE